MHPVNHLLDDIYRNDWGLASVANTKKRRGMTSPWRRDLRFLVDRKRG